MGLQAYVLGAYVLIGSTFYNYLAGNVAVQYEGRYSATGVNANDVALILILGLPFGLFIVMQLGCVPWKKSITPLLRALNLLYVPLSIFAIILTGSRTSLIAVIPFVVYIIATQRIKVQRKILIVILLFVAILTLLPFAPQTLLDRIGTIGSSIRDADMGGRVTMWRKSIAVLAEHPVFGVGSGVIDHEIGGAVHNTLISVATETGFIGLILFLSITGLAVYAVLNLPKSSAGLWLAIFTIWAIGAFSLSWEFRKLTWILLNFMVIESELGTEPNRSPAHTKSFEASNAEIRTTNSFYGRTQKDQGRRLSL
jgi:O-antigen ligase